MSSTTIVHIVDSGFDAIQRDPAAFVAGLAAARYSLLPREDVRVANHANPATVLPERHASIPRLALLHNDLMTEFDEPTARYYAGRGQLHLLRQRLQQAQTILARFAATLDRADAQIRSVYNEE